MQLLDINFTYTFISFNILLHVSFYIPYSPCMVYLPAFTIIYHKKSTIHVGKYTVRPIDPVGKNENSSVLKEIPKLHVQR